MQVFDQVNLATTDDSRLAIARSLGRDPVAFRKANLLATGGKTMVGNVVSGALRSGEVLDRLAAQPIWTGRAAEKVWRTVKAPGMAFGVGFGL